MPTAISLYCVTVELFKTSKHHKSQFNNIGTKFSHLV